VSGIHSDYFVFESRILQPIAERTLFWKNKVEMELRPVQIAGKQQQVKFAAADSSRGGDLTYSVHWICSLPDQLAVLVAVVVISIESGTIVP